ncbi:hypothetical protein ACFQGW_23415 [Xanthomonas theicola]|uniref:hypothetical protein n=1 Tax=Xanthomonas theicola TaxID=56464 RepID=UPI000FF89550|nr:hypothetical protein [Xanthomonas theicola]
MKQAIQDADIATAWATGQRRRRGAARHAMDASLALSGGSRAWVEPATGQARRRASRVAAADPHRGVAMPSSPASADGYSLRNAVLRQRRRKV